MSGDEDDTSAMIAKMYNDVSINSCPHHDYLSRTPLKKILDKVNNENNCNNDINMETKKSLPTKSKEKSDGFTTPPNSKSSKLNKIDNQLNFQIELGNKFSVLSQETAENLTTELTSTTNRNIVIAPPPTENLLNAPTPNSNEPKPNYVPPPIMLKVT
ncbi:hypothetical protein TNCV_4080501 [Trichonephila clavipes]|nr:hypothetical protein TNCV_4080501 [Trichonephila clavipes]